MRITCWLLLILDPGHAPRPARPRIHPRTLAGFGVLLGVGMLLAAALWAGVIRGRPLAEWFPRANWWADVLLGGALGTTFALTAWRALDHIPAFKRIEQMIMSTLQMDALRWSDAVILGLIAGIPEEVLFRGAMQPVLGLLLTSVLFGALHSVTRAYFVYATLAGVLLGGLAGWRGALWAPVAAHVMIDLIMFLLLIRRWRRSRYTVWPPDAQGV